LSIASAQPATHWKFEVASIKAGTMNPNRRPSFPQFLPGGRFTVSGVPLRFLIAAAWDVGFQSKRLSGGPDWINSFETFYDIEAKAPEGAFPPGLPANLRQQRERQMLRALLEDRFQLKMRVENKEIPVYAVMVAKGGAKLENAGIKEKECPETADNATACHTILGGRGRGLHGKAVTIADMLTFVENWTDRPLVDKTELQGLFKIETSGWRDIQPGPEPAPGTKAEDGSDAADLPTLLGIFDRLGLKLEPQKATAAMFVVERVERPAEN
jgi:bla regulator protein blaR1